MDETTKWTPRPEIYGSPVASESFGVVEKPLSLWEWISGIPGLRKSLVLVGLAIIWELYARYLNNSLLFPSLGDTFGALVAGIVSGGLLIKIWASIRVLLIGYAVGMALAAAMTVLAITTRVGADILETLTAMFNPLPAIALLPLALIWFGLGEASLVFVLVHSVLWAVTLNTHSGFRNVSLTLRMVGRNYGLRGFSYVCSILIPAALANILSGMKIGWAFAWRTLIAAELVFGVSSGSGGLGWFIYERKNMLDIPSVFAGLLAVILIGLIVENLIFRTLEKYTVQRWGMQV
ncbi:ABC transporter permease [uncultured Castellaniella sp.]|uniref:ABC transporter permease n=1 Tax=uncultured Castellaniella sp. TaxID=647907 RepID=UPI002633A55C|nr:ABC transporter permease [uncultured Castellaniella sp.]